MLFRLYTFFLAAVAAVIVMLPLPFSDLLVMLPVQLLIACGALLLSGNKLQFGSTAKFALGYTLIGTLIVTVLSNALFLLGKFVGAPFAFLWCYALGEVVVSRARHHAGLSG